MPGYDALQWCKYNSEAVFVLCSPAFKHPLGSGTRYRGGIPRSRANCNALMRACEQAGAHAAARRALIALFPVRSVAEEKTTDDEARDTQNK